MLGSDYKSFRKETLAVAMQTYQTIRALSLQIRSLEDYVMELEKKVDELERGIDGFQKDNRA